MHCKQLLTLNICNSFHALRFFNTVKGVLEYAELVRSQVVESKSQVEEDFKKGTFFRWRQTSLFEDLHSAPASGVSVYQWLSRVC